MNALNHRVLAAKVLDVQDMLDTRDEKIRLFQNGKGSSIGLGSLPISVD